MKDRKTLWQHALDTLREDAAIYRGLAAERAADTDDAEETRQGAETDLPLRQDNSNER